MTSYLLNRAIGISLLSATSFCFAQSSNQTLEQIEKVSVVSSRTTQPLINIATSVTVLDQQDIALSTALNVSDLLRSTPSVGVSNSGGIGKNTVVRIRGEEGFRTKLFIDNVELSDPSSPQVAPIFDDVLLSHLSRIEILRGTQGLAYGGDAGGVISMFTQPSQDEFHASASLQTSRYGTKSVSASASGGNQTVNGLIAATSLSSDGFNAQVTDNTNETDGYENQSVYLKANVHLTDQWTLNLIARDVEAENDYDGCFDNTTFAPTNNCLTLADQRTVRAAIRYQADSTTQELAYEKTDVTRDFFSNNQFGFSNSGEINKASYLGQTELTNHTLVYGADSRQEKIDSEGLSRKQHGAFVEWLANFDHQVDINAGIRVDDNDTFGQHTSVRVGAVKRIELDGAWLKLKSSYGTGFRAPSLFEQNYNDGPFAFGQAAGLQLKEENSRGFDVGFELLASQHTKLEVVWFDQTIEDEIVFDLAGFQGYLQATGESHSKGVESTIEHQFENGWDLWANYTYTEAKDTNDAQRLRRPRNKFNFGARTQLLSGKGAFEVLHRVVNDAVDINGIELDDYSVTNLSVLLNLSANVTMSAQLTNLFDRDYQEVTGFNTPGRALHLSLTFSI